MTDVAEEPRKSPYIADLIASYDNMPSIDKLTRTLEAGDIDAAIAMLLSGSK